MAKKGNMKEETPMLKRWKELKAKHPDAVLLFRCGDFYESYQEDAETLVDVLGITLTRRSDNTKIAGFPYSYLDGCLPKLIRAGKRVAICDQLEDTRVKHINKYEQESINNNTNLNTTTNMEEKKNEFICKNVVAFKPGTYYINKNKDEHFTWETIFGFIYDERGLRYKVQSDDELGYELIPDGFKAYRSVGDYHNGNGAEASAITCFYTRLNGFEGNTTLESFDNELYATVYVFENGEVVCKRLPVIAVGCKENRTYFKTTEDAYPTRLECLAHNAATFEDEDGIVREVGGWVTDTTLTSEQEDAIDKFLEACETLKKAGVDLVWDSSCESLHAINGNKYGVGFDECASESESEAASVVMKHATRININTSYYNSSDKYEYGIYKKNK